MSLLRKIVILSFVLSVGLALAPAPVSRADGGRPDRIYVIYAVRKGDTAQHIARRFHLSVRELRHINQLGSVRLKVGQRLKIPVKRAKALSMSNTCGDYYRVRRGDTLNAIARRCHMTPTQILERNGLLGTRSMRVGQWLRLSAAQPARPHVFLPVPLR